MVEAIADFLTDSQDPVGGWRYPHPASSRTILSQALEHAHQLVHACQLLGGAGEVSRRHRARPEAAASGSTMQRERLPII